jgi:hypothetical protein
LKGQPAALEVKKEIMPSDRAAALTNLGQHTHSTVGSPCGTGVSSVPIGVQQMFGKHGDLLRHCLFPRARTQHISSVGSTPNSSVLMQRLDDATLDIAHRRMRDDDR